MTSPSLIALALLLLLGHAPASAQARRIHPYHWQLVGQVGPSDALLLHPVWIAADNATVYAYDAGDFRIKAFDWGGHPRWAIGREGLGPHEFRNVLALELSLGGELWVYDHGNARIDILGPDGVVRREFSMPHALLPRGLLPLSGRRFLAQAFVRSPFLTLFDSSAGVIRRLKPPPELLGRDMIQARLIPGPAGSRWIAWSSFNTDRMYLVDVERDTTIALRGIQPLEFPRTQAVTIREPGGKSSAGVRPDPSNRTGGVAVAIEGGRLLVLMGNAVRPAYRTIDVYAIPSGKYLESFLLPEPCALLTMAAGAFVCLELDPAPQVKIWRRRR